MGNIYANLGDRSTAIEYYFQSLKIAEQTGNKRDIANLLGDIGGTYYDLGDKEKAFEYLKKGYAKMLESGNKIGIAQATGNIGLIYFEQGDWDKAITHYQRSIELMKDAGTDEISHAWINNIADIYKQRARRAKHKDSINYYYDKSLSYLQQALDLGQHYEQRNEIVHSYCLIGLLHEDRHQLKEAEKYYKKCIEQSLLTGEIKFRCTAHEQLSEVYGQQKKYQLQFEHFKNYVLLKDSITNLTGAEKKVRSELNFEFERKQSIEKEKQKQQNELQSAEKKRQKIILWCMISCTLLIMLAAAFMYRSYLIKKRIAKELENKNQKIRNANKIIKEKNHEIRDSINYALHIQEAILPNKNDIYRFIPQHFILYKPKDIVSGDFYFFAKAHNKLYVAAADCTGHGVPGGFMSMIGMEKLSTAIKESNDTGKILSHDGGSAQTDPEYFEGLPKVQWCPIMGNYWFGGNWTDQLYTWSKGEYNTATNKEDDFYIMNVGEKVPYMTDDIVSSKALKISPSGGISPDANWGQIEKNTDSDAFTFEIGPSGGKIDLRIDPLEYLRQLDVAAKIVNASGTTISSSNLQVDRSAEFKAVTLQEGKYSIIIEGGAELTPQTGVSKYGSLGYYGMEGTVTGAVITSVDKVAFDNSVSVYPNPTSEFINISYGFNNPSTQVGLLNITGQTIYESNQMVQRIDLSNFAKGVYFLRVASNGESCVKKVYKY